MTATTCLREARHPFRGTADDLHLMRAWLTGRLTRFGLDDADLLVKVVFIVNELAGNAIKHTASGRDGGTYSVMFSLGERHLWVAVSDQGGSDTVPTAGVLGDLDLLAESGRGLALIAAEAARWGHGPTPGGGRRTWARIALPLVS
jgi:anti-sigma regulatory factor (Ser/Thr protein kinase)